MRFHVLAKGLLTFLLVLSLAVPGSAHVGSPDVFFQGDAGPYRLFVTVRVPLVIPGIAEIEIRARESLPCRFQRWRRERCPCRGRWGRFCFF